MNIIRHGYTVDRTFIDYPDDSSEATIVYFCGCSHNCPGCQNPDMQKFIPFDGKEVLDDIRAVSNTPPAPKTDKVVLSGGDPLFSQHLENTKWLLRHLKMLGYHVCIYTGYDINFVKKIQLKEFDFIKCGVYNKNLQRPSFKDDRQLVLASPNQDFYNSKYKKISTNGKLFWRNHE
jgi:organic radical activating enzyme|nr:MAG TPA: 4Fe-4S single cluster domain protein [Caudoviricetes sp.]